MGFISQYFHFALTIYQYIIILIWCFTNHKNIPIKLIFSQKIIQALTILWNCWGNLPMIFFFSLKRCKKNSFYILICIFSLFGTWPKKDQFLLLLKLNLILITDVFRIIKPININNYSIIILISYSSVN